jgi:hypothetical protein
MQLPHSFALSRAPYTILGYRKDGRPIRFIGGGDGTGDGTGTGSTGAGDGTALNEHGYPDGKPVAEMTSEQQVAYWKHHARKHEQRANSGPDATELERLKVRDAALKKIEDEKLTADERAAQERRALAAARDTATSTATTLTDENTRLKVALAKGLTLAQANRLSGSTQAELEADADAYLAEVGQTGTQTGGNSGGGAQRSGGNRGGDVDGGAKTVAAGADLYKQRHAKQ